MATPEGELLLRHFDFSIMPVANPDGYSYTWTEDRFWQKNRNPNVASRNRNNRYRRYLNSEQEDDCYGVDLNRNFPVGFGGVATSGEPCSNIYRGSAPFSEPESRAIKGAIEERGGGGAFVAFLTLHSYGQYIFVPKTYEEGKKKGGGGWDAAVANNIREIIQQ